MTSALKWAAMRAILMFHNCEGQSQKTVSTDHNFWRERRAEADSNRGPSAYQPNALPLGQTGSLKNNYLLLILLLLFFLFLFFFFFFYTSTWNQCERRMVFVMRWMNGKLSALLMMSWCLMSSDVSWHIRDKLWPMPKHGSIIFYVHGNQKAR